MTQQYNKQPAPNHSGLLDIIVRAKNEGKVFADTALCELENLTGKKYSFQQRVSFDHRVFEIVSL